MEISNELVWVTPDPSRVKRLVALKRNGRWIEIFIGERILVHRDNLYELETKGMVECTNDMDKFVFKTPEEALYCEDKLKLNANGSML